MSERIAIMVLALLTACTDYGHVVHVAPSAHAKLGEIEIAAAHLNALLGEEHFTVVEADSGRMVDGAIVVREEPLPVGMDAHSWWTVHGDRIELDPVRGGDPIVIGHELGHCGGLAHVEDPANLMYRDANPLRGWTLTEQQIETILNGGRP